MRRLATSEADAAMARGYPYLLVLAATLSFAPAITGQFVWIDRAEILDAGYRVTSADDFRRLWVLSLDDYLFRNDQAVGDVATEKNAAAQRARGGYWRPLYALGLTKDWWLHGDAAWRWHVMNIVWHVAVVLALYMIGTVFFPRGTSFCATLLFAVHPLAVHSVAWISGRKDLQCAFFGAAAVLGFLQLRHGRRPALWVSASCLATIAAIGFKELGLCVPIFLTGLVLLDVPALLHSDAAADAVPRAVPPRSWRWAVGCQVVVLATVFVFRLAALGGTGLGANYPANGFIDNLATAARLAWHYVGRVFWPWQPQISDRWTVSPIADRGALLAVGGWLAVALGLVYWFGARRRSSAPQRAANQATALWVPLLWYAVWMLPASGLLPLRHMRAERYLYPASWGLLLFACALVSALFRKQTTAGRRLGSAFAIVVAMAWMFHTAWECRLWQDGKTLFTTAVNRDPDYLEGRVALAELALREEDYAEAVRHSEIAARLAHAQLLGERPSTGYWSPFIARTNHGMALYHLARYEEAQQQFEAAHRLRPQSAAALYHLGLVAVAERDFEQAKSWFKISLESRSDDFLTRSNLAFVYLQLGELASCQELLVPLVESQPANALNLRNLASCYMAQQQYGQAAARFTQLLTLDGVRPIDVAKLAWCEAKTGAVDQARRHLRQATQLAAGDPTVMGMARMVERELSSTEGQDD